MLSHQGLLKSYASRGETGLALSLVIIGITAFAATAFRLETGAKTTAAAAAGCAGTEAVTTEGLAIAAFATFAATFAAKGATWTTEVRVEWLAGAEATFATRTAAEAAFWAFFTWASFVNLQRATLVVIPFELLHGSISFFLRSHRYECKPAGATRELVVNHGHIFYCAGFAEQRTNIFFRRVKHDISYEQTCTHYILCNFSKGIPNER